MERCSQRPQLYLRGFFVALALEPSNIARTVGFGWRVLTTFAGVAPLRGKATDRAPRPPPKLRQLHIEILQSQLLAR